MTQYLALVKVNVKDEPGVQRHDILSDLAILGARLVEEYGMSADQVAAEMENAIDVAYEAERDMEGHA